MKTKKQKLPSKKFLKEAQQKQHSEALREILNAADKARKTASGYDSKKRKSLLEHAKKLSKPAHTEVFEGYGVIVDGTRLICGTQTQLPCFTISKDTALFTAGIENCVGKSIAKVVKLRAEFKVV